MKRILIPVGVVSTILLGFLIWLVVQSYNDNIYERHLLTHFGSVSEQASAIAEYDGLRVCVSPENLLRINDDLGRKSRKRVTFRPDYIEETQVRITFPDGAEFLIAEDPDDAKLCYILYTYDGTQLYYSTSNLDTLGWVRKAVSLEGLYVPNQLLDDE